MQNPYAVPYLIQTLENENLDTMVRHEVSSIIILVIMIIFIVK